MKSRKGFTLIELLIVVAIIAILAAIAVPNFLEAQVRAKISRSRSDMRTMATGLEAYSIDNGKYPPWLNSFTTPCFSLLGDTGTNSMWGLCRLTSPIAYLSTVPYDAFRTKGARNLKNPGQTKPSYDYVTTSYYYCTQAKNTTNAEIRADTAGYKWAVAGVGPSLNQANPGLFSVLIGTINASKNPDSECFSYDPSNGTVSRGFLIRTNKGDWTVPLS